MLYCANSFAFANLDCWLLLSGHCPNPGPEQDKNFTLTFFFIPPSLFLNHPQINKTLLIAFIYIEWTKEPMQIIWGPVLVEIQWIIFTNTELINKLKLFVHLSLWCLKYSYIFSWNYFYMFYMFIFILHQCLCFIFTCFTSMFIFTCLHQCFINSVLIKIIHWILTRTGPNTNHILSPHKEELKLNELIPTRNSFYVTST